MQQSAGHEVDQEVRDGPLAGLDRRVVALVPTEGALGRPAEEGRGPRHLKIEADLRRAFDP